MDNFDIFRHLNAYLSRNITNYEGSSIETLNTYIDSGLLELHTTFHIKTEQAIIVVPAFRKTFRIDTDDPDVIMESYKLITEYEQRSDNNKNVNYGKKLNNILDKLMFIRNIPISGGVTESISEEFHSNKVLQLLDVSDDKGTEYFINQKNVFARDQITLYFPKAKEGDLIYVTYKPYPVSIRTTYPRIDLPDTLFSCLYAYVALQVVNSIELYKESYPNMFNAYINEIQKAKRNESVLPEDFSSTLQFKKGFY